MKSDIFAYKDRFYIGRQKMVEFGVNKMLDFNTFDIEVHINTISQSIKV